MKTSNKNFWFILFIFACVFVLLAYDQMGLKEEGKDKKDLVPVSVSAWEQVSAWEKVGPPKRRLLSFFVDREVGGTPGGDYCCVMLPKHWRPGLSVEVYWDYTAQSEGSPPPQKTRVNIEEYKPENIGTLNLHFLPNHRIRAIVSDRRFGFPFYPMEKEDWINWGIDEDGLRNWKENYFEMIKMGHIPNDEDWKWAAQWGLYKEEATRRNNSSKQEP